MAAIPALFAITGLRNNRWQRQNIEKVALVMRMA